MTLSLRRPVSALPAALLALVATLALSLGLTAVTATLTAGPASAHDRLLSSDPADGAQLAAPPAAITLTFNTEPLAVEPQVVVSDSAGTVVTQGAPTIDGSTATFAIDPAVALGGDTYTVAWRVVSSDGHPIEGTFAFAVAAQPEPAPEATEEPTTDTPTETASPDETASAEATTDAATETTGSGSATDAAEDGASLVPVLIGLGVVVVAAAVIVVVVLRRRDGGPDAAPGDDDAPHDPQG